MASFAGTVYRAAVTAYDFSQASTIVDVGGGHGALLATILHAVPQPRAILFERPHVVAAAEQYLSASGLDARCDVVGGDFLTAVPSGGDIYLLSHVIHDWDDADATTILTNCSEATQPDGTVVILEQVVPTGNTPALSKRMDLTQLLGTHGRERTEAEYRDLYQTAGLGSARVVPTNSLISLVEGRRPSAIGD